MGSIEVFSGVAYYNGPSSAQYVQNGGSASLINLNATNGIFENINVSGATTLGSLTVTGNATFTGNLTVQDISVPEI